MRTHSVENRFIGIVFGALLIFAVPLFLLFLHLSSERDTRETLARGEIMLSANAKALGKPLWDFDIESVRKIASAIVSGKSVARVRVTDVSGQIDVTMPAQIAAGTGQTAHLSTDILYDSLDGQKKVGVVEMEIEQTPLLAGGSLQELYFIGIFAFTILVMFATAIIGNRLLIMKPLLRLTAAIEATRRLGSRHHVDWISNDEMGKLASNFNEMQTRLAQEEAGLRAAHEIATAIYNLTPAMLYSVSRNDQLTAVSDYWLLATGYRRDEVIGRSFLDFIERESRATYLERKRGDEAEVAGVTIKFRRAGGEIIDVLIRETMMHRADEAASLSVMTDVTRLKDAENRNLRQAITDHLTGLLNRQGFESALEACISAANSRNTEIACLFVDLDRFKWINDNLGHAAGDEVLRTVVSRLRAHLRPDDTIARLGGDEFAILIAGSKAEKTASMVAERIIQSLEEPIEIEGQIVSISASIGMAIYPHHATCGAELLQKSDIAMYARKRDGKNGIKVFDHGMEDAARNRAKIESHIEAGLKQDWFDAWLQPVYDINSGRIAGFEALMRLIHPVDGVIPPANIIQVAEETGAIRQIGEHIFEKAVSHLSTLSRHELFADAYVAVNISPLQFEPGLLERMSATLLRHGIPASRVTVEITEAVLMHHNPLIREIFDAMRLAGFRIALDDFGTGYSSLSYLHRFPVDIVKIDQSFTRSLTDEDSETRQKSRMLVEGINAISHQMNCKVIAEGIETVEQESILAHIGVDCGQGYLFSRPAPVEALIEKFISPPKSPQESRSNAA
jgi:diguanylate cyclase (GGDEF)-like protein/PAS domain S-box-containing protein